MTHLLSGLMLILLAGDPPSASTAAREPNPLAPSLPLLTEKEEDQLDRIIDRFIQQDIGTLQGDDARQAVEDFQRLGTEASFALLRGLNRAAKIEGSCPAVLIAKKLARIFSTTRDPDLLQFARENIGLGITHSRHMAVLQDLRVVCMVRKSQLARQGITMQASLYTPKPRGRSIDDLIAAANKEHGSKLRDVLAELSRRDGPKALAALGIAAGTYDRDIATYAQGLLEKSLARQGVSAVRDGLKDDRSTIRAAAAKVVGKKGLKLVSQLIDLFGDDEVGVRAAAHQALVQLNRGTDLGPQRDADDAAWSDAAKRWRDWWHQQDGR